MALAINGTATDIKSAAQATLNDINTHFTTLQEKFADALATKANTNMSTAQLHRLEMLAEYFTVTAHAMNGLRALSTNGLDLSGDQRTSVEYVLVHEKASGDLKSVANRLRIPTVVMQEISDPISNFVHAHHLRTAVHPSEQSMAEKVNGHRRSGIRIRS